MDRRFFTGDDAGTWRFRISKPGVDARTAPANSTGLLVDSAWAGSLPIHAIVSITTPASAVSSFSVSWSALGFTPIVQLLRDKGATYATGYSVFNYSDLLFEQYYGLTQSFFMQVTASGATFYTNSGNFPTSRYLGDLFVFNAPIEAPSAPVSPPSERQLYIGDRAGAKVIRLSKPGIDAETANPSDLLLASDASQFQVIYLGRVTLSAVTTTVSLPADCTGCRVYAFNFHTTRSPSGPVQFVKFDVTVSDSTLTITITGASNDGTNTVMPPNFANFTRAVSILIMKD